MAVGICRAKKAKKSDQRSEREGFCGRYEKEEGSCRIPLSFSFVTAGELFFAVDEIPIFNIRAE